MSVFTKTTEGKVMGLILGFLATVVLTGSITCALTGFMVPASILAGVFFGVLFLAFAAALYLEDKAMKTKIAALRRQRLYA